MAKNLWFNQSGDDDGAPELPLGDTIDKFTPTGEFVYSHPFDENKVPKSIKITVKSSHCRYLKLELENLYNKLNFANSQQEIEKIYSAIDLLQKVRNKKIYNCN